MSPLGHMLSVTDPNAGHVDYTYDRVGNLIQRVDSLGQTQTWEYGSANRLMRAVMTGDPHGRPDYEYEYGLRCQALPITDFSR